MSNFILKKYNSDSSDDDDYKPEEDPEWKQELSSKVVKKTQKLDSKTQEKLEKIWNEMNFKTPECHKTDQTINCLKIAEDIIKKQKDEMNDLKTVIFAGSEYVVDKTGTLRLKTLAEQEIQKLRVTSTEEQGLTNSSVNDVNVSLFTNSEANELATESVDILKSNVSADDKHSGELSKEELKKRFDYLSRTLEKINNRPKVINAVKKSKMDWKQYTKKEQISDQLEKNRKNGILQKQNFLIQVKETVKNINADLARKKVHI